MHLLAIIIIQTCAAPIGDDKQDFAAFVRDRVTLVGGYEAAYVSKSGRSKLWVSVDASTGGFWYLFDEKILARSADGTPLEGVPRAGGLRERPIDRRLNILSIAEQSVSPSLLLREILAFPDEIHDVARTTDGGFTFKLSFPMGSRAFIPSLAPKGFSAEGIDEIFTVSSSGVVTGIERPQTNQIYKLEYDPRSLSAIPVSTSIKNGEWLLDRLLVWHASPPHPFTLKSIEDRAARSSQSQVEIVTPVPTSDPEASKFDGGGIVSTDLATVYRWPLILGGSILIIVGVVAYVRTRR
jgi:hypothetical protein